MLKHFTQYFSGIPEARRKQLLATLIVVAVAAIGTILLVISHAASPYASKTADSGTLSGAASEQSCIGADDGNCVVFGSNSSPVLILSNDTISWPAISGITGYKGAISNGPRSDTSRTTTYQDLGDVTTWTPASDCGKTDYYGVASEGSVEHWSNTEVSITWPACGGGGGNVIFNGDFSTGDTSQYNYTQLCTDSTSKPYVVTSPVPAGSSYAMRFSVDNSDVVPTVGSNPSCPHNGSHSGAAESLLELGLFHEGDDRYIGMSAMFPSGFPTITNKDFFQVSEIFGYPFSGSPPVEVDVRGNSLALDLHTDSQTYSPGSTCNGSKSQTYVTGWIGPAFSANQWNNIILHVHLGDTASTGSVQLYYNGVLQTLSNGSTTMNLTVMDPCVNYNEASNSADTLYIDQYRTINLSPSAGTPTVSYMAGVKVGTSYSSVAP